MRVGPGVPSGAIAVVAASVRRAVWSFVGGTAWKHQVTLIQEFSTPDWPDACRWSNSRSKSTLPLCSGATYPPVHEHYTRADLPDADKNMRGSICLLIGSVSGHI